MLICTPESLFLLVVLPLTIFESMMNWKRHLSVDTRAIPIQLQENEKTSFLWKNEVHNGRVEWFKPAAYGTWYDGKLKKQQTLNSIKIDQWQIIRCRTEVRLGDATRERKNNTE